MFIILEFLIYVIYEKLRRKNKNLASTNSGFLSYKTYEGLTLMNSEGMDFLR